MMADQDQGDVAVLSLKERLGALNDGPIFLEQSFLQEVVLPQIAYAYVLLSAIFVIGLMVADHFCSPKTSRSTKRKVCYQFTNLCANIILTLAGFYFEFKYVLGRHVEPEESAQGFREMVFFSTFQLGFQFWAIPVGILLVGESGAMIAHHLTVIAVAVMSGFLRNGFRYWTAFFYGIIELSSIPLVVMNYFKANPSLIEKYPNTYNYTRLVFSILFLLVRIVVFVPRLYFYLRSHFFVFSQHPNLPYRIFMSVTGLSSVFLLLLQFYWGVLIVQALHRFFTQENKKKKA